MGVIDDFYSNNPAYTLCGSAELNLPPVSDYDEYIEKYQFADQNLTRMLQENQINLNEQSSLMYLDLAWQAISKYLCVDYDDSKVLHRCSFAIAQLAYIYYYNDRIKREVMSGKAPVTQMSIGSNSVTFGSKKIELDSFGLTPDIKSALPPRRLRAF